MASSATHNSVMGATSTQVRVETAQRLVDRIRPVVKGRNTELDKLTAELSFILDRVRSLENKATEADRLELAMDTMRKGLENSQQDLRDTERQLRQEQRDKQKLVLAAELLEKEMSEKKASSRDLRLQVKEELQKIATLEQKMDDIDEYKKKCSKMNVEIEKLKREANEQKVIAQHARQCLREERDKIRGKTQDENELKRLREELHVIQSENKTLKKLLGARHTILSHHAQILASAKKLVKKMIVDNNSEQMTSLLHILDSQVESNDRNGDDSEKILSNGDSPDGRISTTTPPDGILKTILRQTNHGGSQNSLSTSASNDRVNSITPRKSTSNFVDFRDSMGSGLNHSHSHSDSFNRSMSNLNRSWSHVELGGSSDDSGGRKRTLSTHSNVSLARSWVSDREEKSEEEKREQKKLEDVIKKSVTHGDRVIVDVTPNKSAFQSRQKMRKLVFAPAQVMYLGHLENAKDAQLLFVGVHLDEPVGTSDGTFKGLRYFTTNYKHGKFLPAKNIVSVLDRQTGKYKKIESLVSFAKQKEKAAFLQQQQNQEDQQQQKLMRKLSMTSR